MTTGYLTAYENDGDIHALLDRLAVVSPWDCLYAEKENAAPGEYAVNLYDARDFAADEVQQYLAVYPVGRLFCRAYELRWQRTDSNVYAVQVAAEQPLNLPDSGEVQTFDCITNVSIHLWGEPLAWSQETHRPSLPEDGDAPPVWIETRIPRPLNYPLVSRDWRVFVNAVHYCQHGIIQLTRWTALENVLEKRA